MSTTWKGFFDRLEGIVMGDRRARTSDAVLNVVTAAGLVSFSPTCECLVCADIN